jgi:hypothetical protein
MSRVPVNPANRFATEAQSRDLQGAVQTLGLQLRSLNASTASELDSAFGNLVQERVGSRPMAEATSDGRGGGFPERTCRRSYVVWGLFMTRTPYPQAPARNRIRGWHC